MLYSLLKLTHIIGVVLIGAGLIGVWMSDLRSRQLRELHAYAEAVRNVAVFYDGLVLPGALLLMVAGAWLILAFYGGSAFLRQPWLAGMVVLFLIEFVEGNTITRVHFMRLRRLTRAALAQGRFTPALLAKKDRSVPTFTHFLDLPVLLLIVTLGTIRPESWALFGYGVLVALITATALTYAIPRLYPTELGSVAEATASGRRTDGVQRLGAGPAKLFDAAQ